MTGASPLPGPHHVHSMMMHGPWTAHDTLLAFGMWIAMMLAMMVPGVAPAILRVARPSRDQPIDMRCMRVTLLFTVGYVLVWSAVSAFATGLQWLSEMRGLLSPSLSLVSTLGGALLLLGVGLYEISSTKRRCLRRVHAVHLPARSPQPALQMGLRYGCACAGACAPLMSVAFVAGLMNLTFMVALTLWVTAERLLPFGHRLGSVSGAGLISWSVVGFTAALR